MRTDILKRKILQMFNDSEFHGYDISKKLAEESEEIELSRLYRVLNDMAREGLLIGRWEKSDRGPKKKVYSLDNKGREERKKMLLEAIEIVHTHYDQYLMTLPKEYDVFEILVGKILKEVIDDPTIVYISPFFAAIHHRMISTIIEHREKSSVYLLMPRQEEITLNSPNLVQMEGFYSNIPLKQDFGDLLFITGVPPANILEKAIEEWKRCLKTDGRIAIVTPSVLLNEENHPMDIGQFVENREHAATRRFEFPRLEEFENTLVSNFESFTKYTVIHLTLYIVN